MDSDIALIWIFLILVIAIVVFGAAIFFSIRKPDSKNPQRPLNVYLMRRIFRSAIKKIETNIISSNKKYDIPWVVLFNEGTTEQRLPLEKSGITATLRSDDDNKLESTSFIWHFFSRGVLIELNSDSLRAGEFDDISENRWEEFLRLCGSYRSQRPIDSIVISIPANLLLKGSSEKDVKQRISDLAENTSRRIWIAQNRYAMRFGVYVVISGCEEVEGFSEFGSVLPKSMKDGIFGWSSPHDASVIFNSTWVGEAFDSIESSVLRLTAELAASDVRSGARIKEFLLPSNIAKLRSGLQVYLQKLMGINSFHEPFFFRGIYLSGQQDAPLFLKDVFEIKVFPEYGIARAAHSQKLKNPIMNRFVRWTLILFFSVWSLGLIFTTVKGSQILPKLVAGIEGLNKDAQQKNQAAKSGEILDFEWYRNTAVSLMVGLEEVASARIGTDVENLYSPFIPGSWPLFDDVFQRSVKRIERDFGELGINTFRRALELKTAELTGSQYDELSGALLNAGSSCLKPKVKTIGLTPNVSESLNIPVLPEFRSLQMFVLEAEELEKSVKAMKRLKINSRTSEEDLRFLARYALNVDLSGELSGIINLFQRSVKEGKDIVDAEKISSALRCSMVEGILALNNKIFAENPLIEDERNIIEKQEKFLALPLLQRSSGEIIDILTGMQLAIEEQELLVSRGGGLWMDKPNLNLGSDYELFLSKIADNKLLGKDIAEKINFKTEKDFATMKVQYNTLIIRGGTEVGLEATVDKNGNEVYELSKARKTLRDALEKLLDEPFMVPTVGQGLNLESDVTNFVSWDANYLNEALKLKNYRDKILADDIPVFPKIYQPIVKKVIDQQISLRLTDLLMQAYSKGVYSGQELRNVSSGRNSTSYSLNLEKLDSIKKLLRDMNRFDEVETLNDVIFSDALLRLRLINDDFINKSFFSPSDPKFSRWKGGKGLMRSVFGVNDTLEMIEAIQFQVNEIEDFAILAAAYSNGLPDDFLSREKSRWKSIYSEIEAYKKKLPTSNIARLEKFLISLSKDFDLQNCTRILNENTPAISANNYFKAQHLRMYTNLNRKCQELRIQGSLEKWRVFSNDFEEMVGNRKPFIRFGKDIFKAKEFQRSRNIEYYEIQDVFSRIPTLLEVEELATGEEKKNELREFYSQLYEVKNLFAPFLQENSSGDLSYGINLKFRTNRDQELEANRIIDWSMEIGGEIFNLRDKPRQLFWRPGDSILVRLRFAENTPVIPAKMRKNPYYSSNKKTLIYKFDGPWALFDMLQLHRAGYLKKDRDREETMMFQFPIKIFRDREKKLSASMTNARVFISLTINDPVSNKVMKWPKVFPTKVPKLDSDTGSVVLNSLE